MAKTSTITKALLGTAFALGAMTVANDANAQALQPRQCVSLAQFNQTLAAEGQRTLVIGDRVGIQNDQTVAAGARAVIFVNGVSSNADGSIGYLFEGDKPRGTLSTRVCISAVLENVRLFDARRTDIPRDAYLGGRFNEVVNRSAAEGSRPMVIADTVFGTGSARRNGSTMVLFGDVADREADVATLSRDGTPSLLATLQNADYTQAALDALNRRQVASLALR
jgi:hypothetical protein